MSNSVRAICEPLTGHDDDSAYYQKAPVLEFTVPFVLTLMIWAFHLLTFAFIFLWVLSRNVTSSRTDFGVNFRPTP